MQRIDFNESWEFFNGKDTMIVNLPHDAILYENRDRANPASGASAYFAGNKYSYRKKFQINDCQEKNLILQCEGVYQNASVLVNGKQAAQRPYGYVNFYTDLTPYLCEGENEIEIIADNAAVPNTRYYSGAGIYREVHLLTAGNSYITPEGVKITTESQDTIRVRTEFVGEGTVHVCVCDNEQTVVEADGADVILTIPDAKTWDEHSPYLYHCKVSLQKDGIVADEATERFGIRTISWNGHGFFVNGKDTLLRGACVHYDNGILGACSLHGGKRKRDLLTRYVISLRCYWIYRDIIMRRRGTKKKVRQDLRAALWARKPFQNRCTAIGKR